MGLALNKVTTIVSLAEESIEMANPACGLVDTDVRVLRWGRVFAIASTVTPLLLGVCLGAVASGAVPRQGRPSSMPCSSRRRSRRSASEPAR